MTKLTPKERDPIVDQIKLMLSDHQIGILIELHEETNQVAFSYIIPENVNEDLFRQGATLSSIMTGLFLLPDELFDGVIQLTNHAMMVEASKNEWFKNLLTDADPEALTKLVQEDSDYAGI